MWIAIVSIVLIALVVWYVVSRGRYYNRIFSGESFREFHGALSRKQNMSRVEQLMFSGFHPERRQLKQMWISVFTAGQGALNNSRISPRRCL